MAEVVRDSVREQVHAAQAETSVELSQRQLDTVELVVQGVSLRAIAERHGLKYREVREDYLNGMRIINDRSIEATLALRDEVTMRQRLLIFSNMPKARAGDRAAAAIVQRADEMLMSIWGLRSVKIEKAEIPADPVIAAAMDAYLTGITEQVRK